MISKGLFRGLALALLGAVAYSAQAVGTEIRGVRLWDSPAATRVVFDTDSAARFELFALREPDRLVIDVSDAKLLSALPDVDSGHPLLSGIRAARHEGGDLRVVMDLKQAAPHNSFVLRPNKEYGHRLVIDLEKPQSRPAQAPVAEKQRDLVIAIDAGHGGEDPGARGRRGTREKDVVLQIARRLADLVDKQRGMRAVLTRDGDYYISLRERIDKARQHKADLFVSIHADAFRSPKVNGSSVYVLSSKGASDEAARWLAESENAADLIGGVRLDDKDNVLASVLLDLSLTGKIEASTHVAEHVLNEISEVTPVHRGKVQYAGFVVLKSPDVPSLLVETAFISNPREERKLKDRRFQQKLAVAMLRGIKRYFADYPVPGTLLAASPRTHTIRRGETLSSIAEQYSVPLGDLRVVNRLSGDLVQVGQVLEIP